MIPTSDLNTKPAARRLSHDLFTLAQDLGQSEVRLEDVLKRFEGRVYTLLLVLLSLPFCLPITLPGLSTPFGIVIAVLGLRYAFKKEPWVPNYLLKLKINPGFFTMVLKIGSAVLYRIEKILHPRWDYLFRGSLIQFFAGFLIFLSACVLLLPSPFPFGNMLPALAIILVAAAMAERDGLTLILGLLTFITTLVYFGLIFWFGIEFTYWIFDSVCGFFKSKA